MRLTRLKISNYSKIGGRHLARVYRIVIYSLQIYSTNVAGVYMGLNISEMVRVHNRNIQS